MHKVARRIYENNDTLCNCTKHQDSSFHDVWKTTSEKPLVDYILCQPIKHENIPRDINAVYTMERKKAEEAKNMEILDTKFREKESFDATSKKR